MKHRARRAAVAVAAAGFVLLSPAAASAHGHASHGDLEMEIGFASEPAYTGQPNAVELLLVHDGKPVTHDVDVRVEVGFGDETSDAMSMEPFFFFEDGELEFGSPGEYRANFVPSQAGPYTFHLTGTVEGERIDETMSSGPKTFDKVDELSSAEFPPVDAPTTQELSDKLDAENGRTDEAVGAAQDAAASAEDAASTARMIGIVGVVLGALGLVAAIGALAAGRRRAA